jgi:hypothetical protein
MGIQEEKSRRDAGAPADDAGPKLIHSLRTPVLRVLACKVNAYGPQEGMGGGLGGALGKVGTPSCIRCHGGAEDT